MIAIGARSITAVLLLVGSAVLLYSAGLVRDDYWAQLDPWVPFLAAAFAVLCGALVVKFWRMVDRSEYYFRIGERMPWAGELALVGSQHRTLIVGHAPHTRVVDFPPAVMRVLYTATFLGVGLVTVTNRAVALLRDVPHAFTAADRDLCAEPKPPPPPTATPAGCKLVIRAYQLGYATTLGSCAPRQAEAKIEDVCKKRQRDEPYLHYAWRLFDGRLDSWSAEPPGHGVIHHFSEQLDHVNELFDANRDSVAMQPRSSHHLFTNLPDPRPSLGDRVHTALERGCGARLAHLTHFPPMQDTPAGRSLLLEQVIDQLMFNPAYKPVVAQCGETIIHWAAPPDTCAKLVAHPRDVLAQQGSLDEIDGLLGWRQRKAELARLHMRELAPPAPADRVVSFQCLMFGDRDEPPAQSDVAIDGETLRVRATAMAPLTADGASQIRLYKRLAALLAEGFSYGRLSSNESIGAKADDAATIAAFKKDDFLLTKLELLRDADLFVGNEWLTARGDLLDVYPYHLHLQNFIEIFRRQYQLHRGRL